MVDAKQIIIEEIKHIAYHFSGVSITDETAEPYAESLLYKLVPTPVKLSDMLPMEIPPNGVMVKSESIEKLKAFIEPSKDAKRIVMDELKLAMTCGDDLETIADRVLQKLPQPKRFNEAEIRAICVGVLLPPLGNVPVMHILGQINVLVRNLATLTSKDNIKEYIDE